MSEEKVINDRVRAINLLLYEEDSTHMKALDTIKLSYDYALCWHDKDVDVNGVIKKKHCHVVVRLGKNARWLSAISKELNLAINYIQPCKNLDKSLEYLIHFNDKDKYQYEFDEVEGSLKHRLQELINSDGKTEGEKVYELIEFIENYEGFLKVTEFSKYCAKNGFWDVYRRSGVIFNRMIEEKNLGYRVKACKEVISKREVENMLKGEWLSIDDDTFNDYFSK